MIDMLNSSSGKSPAGFGTTSGLLMALVECYAGLTLNDCLCRESGFYGSIGSEE
ncbi:MAG TPA: hypothetical protein VI485_23435 [Vicinamibacterales bacterium]|nr:hypothetical protein [Vicinamibacterales bacterium]